MKNIIITLLIMTLFVFSAVSQEKGKNELTQKRSRLFEASDFGPRQTSYPYPFEKSGEPLENVKTQAAISTGYYFVNSFDAADKPWKPAYIWIDTTEDSQNWKRIISGPYQHPKSWYETAQNKNDGYRYFRHKNFPDNKDSVDDVYAGPIPIGFEFEYNGLTYDSFYVLSNGAIMLSNARYFYDNSTPPRRKVVSNNYTFPNCYNTESMDWFIRSKFNKTDGTSDPTEDDWGWQMATLLSVNPESNPADILMNNTSNLPIISPFWGDGYLSQWNAKDTVPRDRGKVFFYRNPDSTKVIIYFVDWQLKGNIDLTEGLPSYNIQPGTSYDPDKMTPSDDGYISVSGQIVLDKTDSSITFNYDRIRGQKIYSPYLTQGKELLRFNTHSCVTGEARHLNFDSKKYAEDTTYTGTLPWAGTYNQNTFVWSKYITKNHTGYPEPTQAVKFKQWKNTLRAVDIGFRVRKKIAGETGYTEPILTSQAPDFEILAGHEQVGQLQPVAIVQNLTNDIQGPNGVNYQPQDLNFRARMAIINQATRRPLYNKYLKVDSIRLAKKAGDEAFEKIILSKISYDGKDYTADTMHSDYYDSNNHLKTKYNGIPPYDFVQIYFPPFEPNDLYMSNIGLMKAYLMLDPTDPSTQNKFGDSWSFDDTLNVRFWVMRHIPNDEPFNDDVTEFHVVPENNASPGPIPSVFKWVSIGATVASGDQVSQHPLPPRDEFYCDNDEVYPGCKIGSPTIKLERGSNVPIQEWGGDEIRSYPIDMKYKMGAVLTLAVQRSTKRSSWDRGWSDESLIGCEHRVVASDWYNVIQEPDELRVEFAKPSPNWRDGSGITNISEENWRYHPSQYGQPPITNMSAFTLFGGGGYMVGFSETKKDSAYSPPIYTLPNRAVNGLRYDYYDDGIDFEYKKIYIPIPDTLINASNEGAKYFRFRVKVYAKNNQRNASSIPDDEDPFYVDNVRILYHDVELIDIEINKVSVDFPYSIVPASQATSIPINITISSNTDITSPSFWVKTSYHQKEAFDEMFFLKDKWIWRGSPDDHDYEEKMEEFRYYNQRARDSARWVLMRTLQIHCHLKQLPFLRPGSNETISMGTWNARQTPPGDYVAIGSVYVPGGDLEPLNDTNYCVFTTRFGPYMSYHPIIDNGEVRRATNDVPELTGQIGQGLVLRGYKMGGTSFSNWMNNFPSFEIGEWGGDGGYGQIAMKFELISEDTIYGYGAFFDRWNSSPDYISYRLYEGNQSPEKEIPNSLVISNRGYDELIDSTLWSQFVFTLLEEPILLKKGTYWIAIHQMGEYGFELGASKVGAGMRCTNVYYHSPQTADKNGSKSIFLNLEKDYRQNQKGKNKVNKNLFAFENGLGSGTWEKFTDTIGNPSYAHLMHTGVSPVDGKTETYSRGSWIPLLVPYFGDRTFASEPWYRDCWPVELSYFRGYTRKGVNELLWETASEIQNHGFFIERRIEGNEDWSTLPEFIKGHGTSNIEHEYNYSDKDIEPNKTYHYRLRQVDLDGTQT
ncbi:MAG: hypothetical protein V1779_05780, partial [bacterium]